MVSQTNEKALEALMEKALSGISREALQEQVGSTDAVALAQVSQYRTEVGHGYQLGGSSDFDREFTIDQDKFWGFLNAIQADELDKLKDQPNRQKLLLEDAGWVSDSVTQQFNGTRLLACLSGYAVANPTYGI